MRIDYSLLYEVPELGLAYICNEVKIFTADMRRTEGTIIWPVYFDATLLRLASVKGDSQLSVDKMMQTVLPQHLVYLPDTKNCHTT